MFVTRMCWWCRECTLFLHRLSLIKNYVEKTWCKRKTKLYARTHHSLMLHKHKLPALSAKHISNHLGIWYARHLSGKRIEKYHPNVEHRELKSETLWINAYESPRIKSQLDSAVVKSYANAMTNYVNDLEMLLWPENSDKTAGVFFFPSISLVTILCMNLTLDNFLCLSVYLWH